MSARTAMEPGDLLASIDAGTAPAILDVRSKAEYDAGHVPGALHVPFWRVAATMPSLSVSREAPVVVYCGHGPRAYIAGAALRRLGFERITYLAGHMSRWQHEGRRQER